MLHESQTTFDHHDCGGFGVQTIPTPFLEHHDHRSLVERSPRLLRRSSRRRRDGRVRGHGQSHGRRAGHAAHDEYVVRGRPCQQKSHYSRLRAAAAGVEVLRLRAAASADGVLCGRLGGSLQLQRWERYMGAVGRAVSRAHDCVGGHAVASANAGAPETAAVCLCVQALVCKRRVMRHRRRQSATEEWWRAARKVRFARAARAEQQAHHAVASAGATATATAAVRPCVQAQERRRRATRHRRRRPAA